MIFSFIPLFLAYTVEWPIFESLEFIYFLQLSIFIKRDTTNRVGKTTSSITFLVY